ncbi:MAG TPA: hypothetical protein VLT45_03745 [Kofleriaceae bacterium]|nr:hypothetical protein [Kofleriaceae bacterium]
MKNTVAITMLVCMSASAAHAQPDEDRTQEMRRARLSGRRLALEIIASGAIGGLAAYGTMVGVCGNEPCLGGALGGWLVDFAVTPAAVWGVGAAMGGRGSIGAAYYGALPALAPFSATTAPVGLQFSLAAFFLPFTSAIVYEISSTVAANNWAREHNAALALQPVYESGHVDGAVGTLGVQF